MTLQELISAAGAKLPVLAAKLPDIIGGGLLTWLATYHVEKYKAKVDEEKTKTVEEGLDRRQMMQDAATIMHEMRAEMARYAQAKAELTVDNQQLSAVVGDYREERLDLLRRIEESQTIIASLQEKLLSLYGRLAAASANAQCTDCPLRHPSPDGSPAAPKLNAPSSSVNALSIALDGPAPSVSSPAQ